MTLSLVENNNSTRADRAPAVLLPYQRRWIEDRSPVKVFEKSRRIGISWAEAADDALLAAKKNGMDVFYISYNKEMTRQYIDDCADWARYYNLAAGEIEEFIFEDEDKAILAYKIQFASGHRITALSSRPSSLRSRQGKIVIDEAAFVDDLPGLLKAGMAMLMWGGRVVIISTHNGEENAFNQLIAEIRAGKKNYSLHRATLDDALEEGLYERICLRLGKSYSKRAEIEWRADLIKQYGDGADEELFCVPSRGSGVFLLRSLVEACMTANSPVFRFSQKPQFAELIESDRTAIVANWLHEYLDPVLEALPKKYPIFFGEDFGMTGDLTVIWPLIEEPLLKYRTPFSVELRNCPFKNQEQILFYILEKFPRFTGGAMDARGNGQPLAQLAAQQFGSYRVNQIMLTAEFYRENMPKFKSAFEARALAIPKDSDTLDDLCAIRVDRGVPKIPDNYNGEGCDGGRRHGDAAVAAFLAYYAATSETRGLVEYKTITPKRFARMGGAY
jgi:phage FluMu gp28-like protein